MMAQSIPENVNQIKLKAGRMPEKANECLADPDMYSKDDIGSTIKLSKDNSEQTFDTFAYDEYTIVGLAYSVLYINMERGSSTLGNGSVKGYIYIPMDGFSTDYYTDIYVCVDSEGYVYSDEYEQSTRKYVDGLEKFMSERAVIRRDAIIDDAMSQLDDAKNSMRTERRSTMQPRLSMMPATQSMCRKRAIPRLSLNRHARRSRTQKG